MVAHEELRFEVVQAHGAVGLVGAVGEQEAAFEVVGPQGDDGLAGHRQAVLDHRRRVEAQEAAVTDDVPLPADGGDAPAVIEQEAIAWVVAGRDTGEVRRAIEGAEELAAAVNQPDQRPAVAARCFRGLKEREVGPEAYAALRVSWRQLEVDDAFVGRGIRVDSERDERIDLLVGAGVAEALAVGVRLA